MRKLFLSLALVAASAAHAAVTDWKLSEVASGGQVHGYIYHTSAQGTQVGSSTPKVATSLRLICSTNPSSLTPPVIALHWSTLAGNVRNTIDVSVDGKPVNFHSTWEQDGFLLYREISESAPLMQAIRTGKSIKFDWVGFDKTRRTTVFDLREFNFEYAKFKEQCKLP